MVNVGKMKLYQPCGSFIQFLINPNCATFAVQFFILAINCGLFIALCCMCEDELVRPSLLIMTVCTTLLFILVCIINPGVPPTIMKKVTGRDYNVQQSATNEV